jgi:hypothetical protein
VRTATIVGVISSNWIGSATVERTS